MLKRLIKFISIVIAVYSPHYIYNQAVISTDLNEVINTAITESPSQLLAKTRLSNEYWQYVGFNSTFKPQLSVTATIPNLTRRIDAIPLPDGSEAFVNRSFMNNSVGLQLTQIVPQTGGNIFVSSSLNRIDLFDTESQDYSKSFLSTPISIGFNQPVFQFNRFKWLQKITDLEYEISKKRFVEENEEIIYDAVNQYFDLYITKLNLEQAKRNQTYLDSLANTSDGRYGVGRISETEMLQVELGAKNANALVNSLELDVQNKNESLRNFLGIKQEVQFELSPPNDIPEYDISLATALAEATRNRSRTADFRLRLLEAQMNLDETEKSNGLSLTINGTFGLTKSGDNYRDVYRDLLDQESITLSLRIPIADWGRRQAQREIAKSNLELEELQIEQDQINFEREITVNVDQFTLKRKQLLLAREALDIAIKRLDIAKKRYQIGKIDVTNLNIAIQEHDQAREGYFNALWSLRRAHHEIRLLTLYDFVTDSSIIAED